MPPKGRQAVPKEEPTAQRDMISDGALGDGWTDEFAPNEASARPEVTLEQFILRRPGTHAMALKLIAADVLSSREICTLLRVSPATLDALRFSVSLGAEKERQGKMFSRAARMAGELAIEKMSDPEEAKKISVYQAALVAGIFTDKGQLLLGGATSRTESVAVKVDAKGFATWQAEMMGSGGAAPGAKGEPVECGAEVIETPGESAKRPQEDS